MEDLRQLIVRSASREEPDPKTAEALANVEDARRRGPTEEPEDPSVDLYDYRQEYEIQTLQQQLVEAVETHEHRIAYIGRVFWLVVAWLACVVLCIVLTGYQDTGFILSDRVLIAFITSTTVNVVGLFVIVAKWLYPSTPLIKKPAVKAAAARPKAKK